MKYNVPYYNTRYDIQILFKKSDDSIQVGSGFLGNPVKYIKKIQFELLGASTV